jgi:hypothetical protein
MLSVAPLLIIIKVVLLVCMSVQTADVRNRYFMKLVGQINNKHNPSQAVICTVDVHHCFA